MAKSVVSCNYSSENIYGWIAGQSTSMPLYSELLQIAQLPTLDQRYQAIKRWPLFASANSEKAGWTSELLEQEYNSLQESLATRYGVNSESYMVDYVWIQRWMPLIRQISRKTFLGSTDTQSDNGGLSTSAKPSREVLVSLFSNVLAKVDMPVDIQSHFLLAFEEILKKPITLFSIESALDRVTMLIQMEHFTATKSSGVQQWIVLQLLLEWSKQYVRHSQLGLPVPIWSEWFMPDMVSQDFSSFEHLQELFFQKVSGGVEWVIPANIFEEKYLLTIDPVVFETQIKQIQGDFLNQSVYIEDILLEVVRFAFNLRQIVETVAVVLAKNLPTTAQVQRVTADYDI